MRSKVNTELHTFRSPAFTSVVNEAVDFFLHTPVHPLPPGTDFDGSGVYALYYVGDFELYAGLAEQNRNTCAQPIYVGKAVPGGWRTARALLSANVRALSSRIKEHARSLKETNNLKISHFSVRFVILRDIESDLVVPLEAELIRRYTPLWNCLVDGFGNHDPGSGRYNQAKSEWDVLHPGRRWAKRLMGTAPELDEIINKIEQHHP